MNVKVIDSKSFSKEEVKNFSLLYEKLLRQYRPRGFYNGESFSIASLKQAINCLPEINQKHLYFYLNKNEEFNKDIVAQTLSKLRTVKYRALYDFEIIKSLQRATDNKLYEPSVALAFIRLYDKFSGIAYDENIPKNFSISKIKSILDTCTFATCTILNLNFGLITGKPLTLKKISQNLNIPIENCKALLNKSLTVLKKEYFAI